MSFVKLLLHHESVHMNDNEACDLLKAAQDRGFTEIVNLINEANMSKKRKLHP